MKKKYIVSVLLVFFLIALLGRGVLPAHSWDALIISFYPDSGKVLLNGEEVQTASPPIIVDDRLYIPIRTISNLIGATITWNSEDRFATMIVPDFSSIIAEMETLREENENLQKKVNATGLYGKVLSLLGKDFLYKESIDTGSLSYAAIRGMIASLGDPYTRFFTPFEVRRRKELLSPTAKTLGIILTRFSGNYIVLDTVKGSPASLYGIEKGDVIRAINGTYIKNMPFDDVKMLMSSTRTKAISLDIVRQGTPITFTMKTADVPQKDFSYEVIAVGSKNVAYIDIRTMVPSIIPKMDEALKTLFFKLKGEADAYIIDLRGNFGGDIDVARGLLGYFLGGKPVYTLIDGDGNLTTYRAPVSQWMISEDRPVYVLIDEGTTSAAEVFAMAMKSYGRAILVGSTTYGKGRAQTVYEFDDGSMLVLTTYEVRGPKGEVIDSAGVLPDVWSMTLYAKDTALNLFEKGILRVGDLSH